MPNQVEILTDVVVRQRLDGFDGPTRQIVVPTRLIVRGSGEIPRPGAPVRGS